MICAELPTPYLEKHKRKLMRRKIKKFNETNWWKWGRWQYDSDEDRIYVNCKTRAERPFFTHPVKNYDGSVLAIFPYKKIDCKLAAEILNNVNWQELGFVCDGRYIFSQRSLENCMLPSEILECELVQNSHPDSQ